MMQRLVIFALPILVMTALASEAPAISEMRSIPTRPGVTLDFLFMPPETGVTHNDALIMFPGGNGMKPFRLMDDGVVHGWSFLVRSAQEFSRHGLTIVTVNPPSDHSSGMSTGFRESPEHAEDIGALATYLESQGIERIFLVGNSRGTLSVAALATRLQDNRIKGVILTSSLEYENFMRWLPLEKIRQPVLMVHNREDACRVSEFSEAEKTRDTLKATTSVDFVAIDGGLTPRSAPCNDLSTHGFYGVEDRVVQAITDWIDGRQVPAH